MIFRDSLCLTTLLPSEDSPCVPTCEGSNPAKFGDFATTLQKVATKLQKAAIKLQKDATSLQKAATTLYKAATKLQKEANRSTLSVRSQAPKRTAHRLRLFETPPPPEAQAGPGGTFSAISCSAISTSKAFLGPKPRLPFQKRQLCSHGCPYCLRPRPRSPSPLHLFPDFSWIGFPLQNGGESSFPARRRRAISFWDTQLHHGASTAASLAAVRSQVNSEPSKNESFFSRTKLNFSPMLLKTAQ